MKRNLLKGSGKVFRFSLCNIVASKGWLISTLALSAVLLFVVPLSTCLVSKIKQSKTSENAIISQVFVCDETEGDVDFNDLKEYGYSDTEWISFESVEAANAAITNTDETLILQLTKDEDAAFALTAYLPEETTLDTDDASALCSFVVENFDVVRMQKATLSEEAAALLSTEIRSSAKVLSEDGEEIEDSSDKTMALKFLIPLLISLVIYTMVAFYGQSLTNSILLEKTNKLMDTMLISVHPFAIVLGKLLATVTSAVFQFLIWMFAGLNGIVSASIFSLDSSLVGTAGESAAVDADVSASSEALETLLNGQIVSMSSVIWTILIVILGFVLYLSLASISGSLASKQEDTAKTNYIYIFTLVGSFLLISFQNMDALIANDSVPMSWTDFFPFTAILSMPGKLLTGDASNWTALISTLLIFAVCILCVYIAAILYKLMVLYRGNPPTPKALLTMFKNQDSFEMEKGESSHDKSGTE